MLVAVALLLIFEARKILTNKKINSSTSYPKFLAELTTAIDAVEF